MYPSRTFVTNESSETSSPAETADDRTITSTRRQDVLSLEPGAAMCTKDQCRRLLVISTNILRSNFTLLHFVPHDHYFLLFLPCY